jgi:hypothetical protein
MNLLFPVSHFDINNVHFLETKNNIIMDGVFTKIIYLTDIVTLNGIYIHTPFVNMSKQHQQRLAAEKNTVYLDVFLNKDLIQQLMAIEKKILDHYFEYHCDGKNGKKKTYKLEAQLDSGMIKYYSAPTAATPLAATKGFVLKISGVWETQTQMGITFKLIV